MPPKFTPESFISAPRRSPAIPNDDGTLALYTVTTYSFESHSQTKETKILDIKSRQSILFTDDPKLKECVWLHGIQILWLKDTGGGKTEFWTGYAVGEKDARLAGIVGAPVENLRVVALGDNKGFAVVVSGLASPEGELFNPESEKKKKYSSAREYTTSSVRWWDHYWTKERSSLWYATLEESDDGSYRLHPAGLVNALKGTRMECPFPDPLGSAEGSFDVCKTGIAFTCCEADAVILKTFKTSLYYLPIPDFTKPGSTIQKIEVAGFTGGFGSSKFSPNGTWIAFTIAKDLKQGSNAYIYMVDPIAKKSKEILGHGGNKDWDHSPGSLVWSKNGKSLYATADDRGRNTLFRIPLSGSHTTSRPNAVSSRDGSVSAAHSLGNSPDNHKLLVTRSNYVDSSIYEIIDTATGKTDLISSLTDHGSKFGLHASQVSDIEFTGSENHTVQAYVVKPSFFKEGEKYPLAFMVHGGPQSSWSLAWSTRWNPALFAEQGYVVVLPNPTGSTGFGEAYCNAVDNDWGGRPYQDLVKCFEYIESSLPFIDTSRAVALGASYGGYMMNWIQGQALAKKFKALVCHDGIFSAYNMLASDAAATTVDDFGKRLWEDKTGWDKFDPAQYTQNWTQPMLIIHSDMDFRCPTTEGWAAYAVLQGKGIESRFLNFPDETHFVLKQENSLQWHKTVLGWINRFAGVDGVVQEEPPLSEPWVGSEKKVEVVVERYGG